MAIQMRRGNSVDFDPSRMVPGEWAVSQDDSKIYMCIRQGVVIEIGTSGSVVHYVEESEAWAVGEKGGVPVDDSQPQYHNNSKYYSQQGSGSATAAALSETNAAQSESNAEAWAVGQRGGIDVPSTDVTYENNSKYYAEQSETAWNNIDSAIDQVVPTITMNWTDGNLYYEGTSLGFYIDTTNGNLCWEVIV